MHTKLSFPIKLFQEILSFQQITFYLDKILASHSDSKFGRIMNWNLLFKMGERL